MIVNHTVIIFANVSGICVELGSYKSPLNIKLKRALYQISINQLKVIVCLVFFRC